MKKVISILFILAVLTVNSALAKSVVKTNENFTISKNTIEEMSTLDLSWTIQYGTGNKSFEVIKTETPKGEEYIVRNQFFEVRYVNTSKGFGVRKIRNNQSKVNPLITQNVINNEEMKKQSLLSSTKLDEEKALGYIAGFVPFLLNENYKHLLN